MAENDLRNVLSGHYKRMSIREHRAYDVEVEDKGGDNQHARVSTTGDGQLKRGDVGCC